jgi:CDGSH-type Zn-finger protein
MTTCKCGLSSIYPVCDYKHFKISRDEVLRQKIVDLVNDYIKHTGETVGIPQTKKDSE